MSATTPMFHFANKLRTYCELNDVETQALLSIPFHLREYGENSDIIRQGDRTNQCCLIVEGLLCRFKLTRSGTRQIISIHVPQDMPDLAGLRLACSDHYIGTLTRSTVALLPHAGVDEVVAAYPRLARSFWRETLIDGSIYGQWLVNAGRRSAHARIAHLLCELALRYKRVGLGDESGFPWDLTQSHVADAAGLSIVHVNRTLQALREKGLVERRTRTRMHILDWHGLVEEGEFDPTYLHLNSPPSVGDGDVRRRQAF